jgi:tripartite-type tricarboxylate transporter receptor subunit TctC
MTSRRAPRGLAFAALALMGAVETALAANETAASYPTKPVRLIVAQGTGSSVDNLGRLLAARLTEEWGRQVIVDNRGGAGGTIGAEIAARSVPDGYTLLVSSTAMQVISPQVYKNLPYHPTRDFAMMTLIGSTQNVLAVNPKVPYKNVTGLIAYAKANPGRINMANAGSGFQSHLAGVLFAHIAGIDVHQIPYKGGTSTTMVAAGESHITIVPMPSVIGQLRAGRLLPLATGGDKRSQALPEVPTFIEAGVPGYVSTGWAGIVAPKGISRQRFDRIYGTLIKIMNNPVTREQLERQGAEPMTSTPEEMLRHINAEYGRFSQAIKLADLKVQ